MRRFFTLFSLLAILFTTTTAQQMIPLDSKGESSVAAKDGKLDLSIAGMNFSFGGQKKTESKSESKTTQKVNYTFGGVSMAKNNHLALLEIGTNFTVNNYFDKYDGAVRDALNFSNHKSICCTINLMTMNVPLNPKRTLGFTMGFGFAMENYTFADKVTLKYEGGSFDIIQLDEGIKKSKININYIHIPLLFDWNIRKGFFVSAGGQLDILMGSKLSYKRPKTTIEGKLPLNPVQVGVTARIGWRRIYAFANYSLLNMYKKSTEISANRISVGVGLFF